jgi:hypothetical protein
VWNIPDFLIREFKTLRTKKLKVLQLIKTSEVFSDFATIDDEASCG